MPVIPADKIPDDVKLPCSSSSKFVGASPDGVHERIGTVVNGTVVIGRMRRLS